MGIPKEWGMRCTRQLSKFVNILLGRRTMEDGEFQIEARKGTQLCKKNNVRREE
jgi:hypothetical protein